MEHLSDFNILSLHLAAWATPRTAEMLAPAPAATPPSPSSASQEGPAASLSDLSALAGGSATAAAAAAMVAAAAAAPGHARRQGEEDGDDGSDGEERGRGGGAEGPALAAARAALAAMLGPAVRDALRALLGDVKGADPRMGAEASKRVTGLILTFRQVALFRAGVGGGLTPQCGWARSTRF